jgi:two-component system OmpR family response regulator
MAGGRCRILVIGGDHESAEQIVESLVASGYEVDLAADGDDGLGRARSGEYAVMTIDRMLPGIDGVAVIRRLREEKIFTPALIVSALSEIGRPPDLDLRRTCVIKLLLPSLEPNRQSQPNILRKMLH